jgi:capsid protein
MNMLNLFGRKRNRGKSAAKGGGLFHAIRAHFASAESAGKDNDWWKADYLSADADANPETRRILRMRSRYEYQNNSYARGVIQCLANDTIGNGPRLRYASNDDSLNSRIERDFTAWAETVRLGEKLRAVRIARARDGESFVLLAQNPTLRTDVKLDLSLIDSDRVAGDSACSCADAGAEGCGKPFMVDGIAYDQYGNPVSYRVLVSHPCDGNLAEERAMLIPAANVIHVFRADRAEQHRGVPELAAALPLFAKLRRYTNAVVASAEKAAEYGGILYTDHPKDDTCAEIEPMDAVTLDVNQLTTMPEGWKMDELYVKAPIATYADFKKEMLSEIGAAMGIPYAIVAGTSAGYTYASAKLDHQTYFRVLRNERGFVEDSILNRLFELWLREWSLANPDAADLPRNGNAANVPHDGGAADSPRISTWNASWLWPMFDNIDMLTAARVQSIAIKNRTTTLATEYARQGKNWKTELAQFEKEQQYLKEHGIEAK